MASHGTSKNDVQVIDDKLLQEGLVVIERAMSEIEALKAGVGEVNLVEQAPIATTLILSFKRIGRIENLVGFAMLEKLCLDNNKIEEITNLSHLKNLKWLDLSFNKIRKIQGVESLKKLEDISLYSNKISVVEGLDQCTALQCLSLGNNKIRSLDEVIKIRRLSSLRMLTLANNPVEAESEYRMTVLAYVDSIKYLDYALIDSTERATAKEQYHDELLDVEEKESVANEKASRDKAHEAHLARLEEAGILFAHNLFDDLFEKDVDVDKLKHLPGVKEHVEAYNDSFKKMSAEYVGVALERFEKRRKQINDFERSVKQLRTRDDTESTMLIESFNNSKKVVVSQLTTVNSNFSHHERVRMVRKLHEELDKVCDELMGIELRLVDKFDAMEDEFDNHMNDAKNTALDMQQTFFRSIEELEVKFSGDIRSTASDLIDRYAREELPDSYLDDEAMSLVVDKDACMGIMSASHDMHIGRILKREDEARSGETHRYQETVSHHVNTEKSRNRDKVLQVHDFYKTSYGSLNTLLSMDEDDAYEEEEHK